MRYVFECYSLRLFQNLRKYENNFQMMYFFFNFLIFNCRYQFPDMLLSPVIERIRVIKKNIRQKVTGSRKKNIPSIDVPTAPIPVHTAYAVPIGIVWVALINKIILIIRATTNPPYQRVASTPAASLALPRQKANAVSNNPATIRIIQFKSVIFD